MNTSNIEWLRTYNPDGTFTKGHVWNMVTGCEKVSQGCKHCYAETMAIRFWKDRKFTDVRLHPEKLPLPLKHKTPTRVFVNSMSDLFHAAVPFTFIREVFEVMAKTPHITYILLTKRPETALVFAAWMHEKQPNWKASENVQIGVSVENQAQTTRILLILQFPAHYHIVSCEPLLGLIGTWLPLPDNETFQCYDVLQGKYFTRDGSYSGVVDKPKIKWVIVGGESGHGARPMHPDWVRALRDQCQITNTPFFFKQWGAYLEGSHINFDKNVVVTNKGNVYKHIGWRGEATQDYPDHNDWLKVNGFVMHKSNEKDKTRLLDGREHNDYIQPPKRKPTIGSADLESTFEQLKHA